MLKCTVSFGQQFQYLVNPAKEIADKSAFILDEMTLAESSRITQHIS
jgi:hypothetical protein